MIPLGHEAGRANQYDFKTDGLCHKEAPPCRRF